MKNSGKYLIISTHILVWLLFTSGGLVFYVNYFSWQKAVFFTLIQNLLSISIFYGNGFLVNLLIERKRYGLYALFFILISIVVIFIRKQLHSFILLRGLIRVTPSLNPETRLWAFSVSVTILILVVSFFYQLLWNRYKAERKYLSLINQHNEAQIQFLKAQINPHFLFNTLNNIYALTVTKSDKAPKMLLLLSDLLRYVIYENQKGKVELRKEVIHLQSFIDLFQMRNEQSVNITFQVTGKTDAWEIEPMILIPLVENCFKHGDFEENNDAFIQIELDITEKSLKFTALNSKNDAIQQKDAIGGVGLENIRKRLNLQYENRYKLNIENQKQTFKVQLILEV